MKRLIGPMTAFLAVSGVALLVAKDPDQRFASVRKAYVTAADDLNADQRPVTACLAKHLPDTTPLTVVTSKDEADVVLTVTRAHLPGNTARATFGGLGKVYLSATLPDGTPLWDGDADFSSTKNTQGLNIPCYLADSIAGKMLSAMRKARDAKR
jgi:hypothetical protein